MGNIMGDLQLEGIPNGRLFSKVDIREKEVLLISSLKEGIIKTSVTYG